jgi:hypothetical protein
MACLGECTKGRGVGFFQREKVGESSFFSREEIKYCLLG